MDNYCNTIAVNNALESYLVKKDWINWRVTNKSNYNATMESFINCYKNRRITCCEYYEYIFAYQNPSTIFIWETAENTQKLVVITILPQMENNLETFKIVYVEQEADVALKADITLNVYTTHVCFCPKYALRSVVYALSKGSLKFTTLFESSTMFDMVTMFNIYRQRDFIFNADEYAKEMTKKAFYTIYEKKEISLYLLDSWLEKNSIYCQCHTSKKECVKCRTYNMNSIGKEGKEDYMYSKEDRDYVVGNLLDYIELTEN
jgi:hypothetical protein